MGLYWNSFDYLLNGFLVEFDQFFIHFIIIMTRLISGLEDDVILSYLTYCPQMNTMKLNGQARLTSKPFLPIISGKIIGFSGIHTQMILVEYFEIFFLKK